MQSLFTVRARRIFFVGMDKAKLAGQAALPGGDEKASAPAKVNPAQAADQKRHSPSGRDNNR